MKSQYETSRRRRRRTRSRGLMYFYDGCVGEVHPLSSGASASSFPRMHRSRKMPIDTIRFTPLRLSYIRVYVLFSYYSRIFVTSSADQTQTKRVKVKFDLP